ncbi:amidase [Gloeothece verrucosa]|uniref:Amidase n=1 Tax=Gloeothece verrucosa (strain PCC 7822) TaxID=497965 RepID=E0UFH2_GLOV7|nr:amidase [Gloeothece verrucosa]ADN16666.1 Amidase [Gloeothece verrucosa PCC 7822]
MNQIDLAFTSALEQAKLIRERQISPLELVEIYLARIERLNPQVGSFFHLAADAAISEAKAKTEFLANNQDLCNLPLFFGVPTAIKDLNAVAGMPCSYGVAALKDNIVNYDDGVVTRIKQAGLIILGKTATSQLGSFPYTEPPNFEPARTPWNLDYTAGGSSGGAASAVAAGLCALAQGSDGGGSIRGPALCCGLVGIKPARGRISNAPIGDFQSGIATNGPLARTVADAAAFLDVMSGYTTGDPYWLPEPKMSFLAATGEDVGQLRIAFSPSLAGFPESVPIVGQAVRETAKRLEEMGHIVEEGCFNVEGLLEPFKIVWQSGVAAAGIPLELLCPLNQWLGEQQTSAGQYLQAVRTLQMISRSLVAFFQEYDVLVLPVYLHQAIRIGEWENLPPQETLEKMINWVAPCPPCNASGLPAITIPTGFDENGLPIAVQLVGGAADEITLIALAAQLEALNPWSHYRPAMATA